MLCLSLSLLGSLAQISVPITPCVSPKNMNGSCTSQKHLNFFFAVCCLLQLLQLYSTSRWVLTASRALCSSVSPFLIAASLDSPTKCLWLKEEWQWQLNSWQIISVLNKQSLISLNASLLWQQEKGLWASGTLTVQRKHLHTDICYYGGDPLLF